VVVKFNQTLNCVWNDFQTRVRRVVMVDNANLIVILYPFVEK